VDRWDKVFLADLWQEGDQVVKVSTATTVAFVAVSRRLIHEPCPSVLPKCSKAFPEEVS